ncbi:MAG: zinc ribbon domain-containing protein [Betaproteobacteria bacterium]|nr:zinc ribbon domain-containing protein [Betaproteobacteria bacterium]
MPIYAYSCDACGFAKDVLQSISAAPLTDCESCGKPEFRKQVTAAGFQLKGSGWYVTDFRNGATPAAKADGDSGTSSAGESTPAATAASTATPSAPAAAPAATSTSATPSAS